MVTKRTRNHVHEIRGASRLVTAATTSVVDLVEAMQHVIGGGPNVLGRPFLAPTRFFSAPVYATIRGMARAIGAGIDVALERVSPLLGEVGMEVLIVHRWRGSSRPHGSSPFR